MMGVCFCLALFGGNLCTSAVVCGITEKLQYRSDLNVSLPMHYARDIVCCVTPGVSFSLLCLFYRPQNIFVASFVYTTMEHYSRVYPLLHLSSPESSISRVTGIDPRKPVSANMAVSKCLRLSSHKETREE